MLTDPEFGAWLFYVAGHPRGIRYPRRLDPGQAPAYLTQTKDSGPPLREPLALPLLEWGTTAPKVGPCRIPLAGTSLPAADLKSLPWDKSFVDYEDKAALHRFAWLLPELLSFSSSGYSAPGSWETVKLPIADWIARHQKTQATEAWQPYTVSERMVNWVLALLSCGRSSGQEASISASLDFQAEYLSKHLEYYGDEFTGNHLSNNGRGLYITGLATGKRRWIEMGRAILLNERSRLFKDRRFLGEGSSHYQFLISRNYIEALWFAFRFSDQEMIAALKPTVSMLVAGCFFFLVSDGSGGWDLPLLGDISPDCPPSWLIGVPCVGAALCGDSAPPFTLPAWGWHRFFSVEGPAPSPMELPAQPDIAREWARLDRDDWTLFLHINPRGILYTTHAHQDTGGFVGYYRGKPLILDAGRRHYRSEADGLWGRDCWSHSILVVDGLNPSPCWRSFYSQEFLEAQAGAKPRLQLLTGGVEVSHGGFARSSGVGLHRRSLTVDGSQSLHIIDSVEGRGRHTVDLIFHLAGRVQRTDEGLLIKQEDRSFLLSIAPTLDNVRIQHAPEGDSRYGWASRRYGGKDPITSVVASASARLPWNGDSFLRRVD